MVDRIKSLMDYYHLSPAQFADRIGFQRSALSHVLSGRNNPSLDFVLKVRSSFPDISLDWLALGEGNQFIDQSQSNQGDVQTGLDLQFSENQIGRTLTLDQEDEKEEVSGKLVFSDEKSGENRKEEIKSEEYQSVRANKTIRKVILLYGDGSFSEHFPEK